ncbi:hypothetical protein B0T22DRAFT_256677 [Podospora appendiculata]|uniref:Mid2 domain-containing protein n=1 Tax=Podospora appendiculata TaxID=314037 RepID=A0AAE1C905_9PEZI|nr:hypothetical protein B0T22DRAFT_256677 [Podospora appendiculata]
MTLLGALTTTFQAPSSCSTAAPQIYQIWTNSQSNYVQGPLFPSQSDCFPSGYDASPGSYYSPGVCPRGYTSACTRTAATEDTGTETAVVCCPGGPVSYTCIGSDTLAPLGCTTSWKDAKAVIGVTVISDGSSVRSTTVTETEGGFAAYGIQVRFRETDAGPPVTKADFLPSQTQSSTFSTATLTATTTPTNTAQSTTIATIVPPAASTDSQAQTKSDGVSTGAAIGIGVGSAIAALLATCSIGTFFYLRWRRKRRRPPVPPKEPSHSVIYNINNKKTGGAAPAYGPYELHEDYSPRLDRHDGFLGTPPRGVHMKKNTRLAELEADVPFEVEGSDTSMASSRRTPDSSASSAWTSRLQSSNNGGVAAMPWI